MSDQPKDSKKLCIRVKDSDSDEQIRSLCENFGTVYRLDRHPNKHLAFVLFTSESDAKSAKDGLAAEGHWVDFGHARRKENSGDSNGRPKKEFRSQQNLADGSENGGNEADFTLDDNRPYGSCLKCNDKAYQTCGRCGDFYCSEECQESDWLTHKRNCFPMPKLVPAKSTCSFGVSRVNLADSTENIRPNVLNNVIENSDDTDGHAKIEPPLRRKEHSVASSKVSDVVTVGEPSKAEDIAVQIKDIPGSTVSPKVAQSPRAQLLSVQMNGASKPSPPAESTGIDMASVSNGSEVFITHVKSYQAVYIRSAATDNEYSKLVNDIQIASEASPKLTVYPGRNDIVMAPFDGMYYRAMVIKSNRDDGTVKVGFLDFGNADTVLCSRLKALPEELRNHRRLIIWVTVKGMKADITESEQAALEKHLHELMENGKGLLIKSDKQEIGQRDEVELYDMITNESLSEALNGLIQKRYIFEDLPRKICNASDINLMIICDRIEENYVTCILKTDVDEFMTIDEKIQSFGAAVKNAPAYKPNIKELCLVEIKEPEGYIWYRCQYQQELVNEKAQVYAFDYGRIHKVEANNIRAITHELTHEIISFVGRLKDGEHLSQEQKQNMIDQSACFAKTVENDDDEHIITLNN